MASRAQKRTRGFQSGEGNPSVIRKRLKEANLSARQKDRAERLSAAFGLSSRARLVESGPRNMGRKVGTFDSNAAARARVKELRGISSGISTSTQNKPLSFVDISKVVGTFGPSECRNICLGLRDRNEKEEEGVRQRSGPPRKIPAGSVAESRLAAAVQDTGLSLARLAGKFELTPGTHVSESTIGRTISRAGWRKEDPFGKFPYI